MDFKQALQQEQQDDTVEMANLLSSLSLKTLEKKGLAVLNLVVNSAASSLGVRTVLELGPDKSVATELPLNLKNGDIVSLQPQKGKIAGGIEGVVTRATSTLIHVAFDLEELDIPDTRVCLVKLVNNVSYNRMYWALDKIQQDPTRLVQLFNGEGTPSVDKTPLHIKDPNLNPSQVDAVQYSVGSEISVIHGPPGTGKTSTIVEIARQLVDLGERVLICGPSNVSVDNIIERLGHYYKPLQLIRLGHPARLSDTVLKHSLDILSKTCDSGQIVRELRAEIDSLMLKVKKTKAKSGRREIYGLVRDLRKDLRIREKAVTQELLLGARIVVTTLHGAGSTFLNAVPKPLFKSIIIDEVSQALVAQCMIPLVVDPQAQRIIIAGDNKQLPPTIVSKDPKVKKVLERTLFDVLVGYYGDTVKHLLDTQYRFPREIMEFPSISMYQSRLKVTEPVASQRLYDLAGVENNSTTESVILWIDTMGGLVQETQDQDSFSTYNQGECDLVVKYIEKLLHSGVQEKQIGVIAPYSAQVSALKLVVPLNVEVHTVDGFQGREKEVIIISLVRSNDEHDVGFVADDRRINVAITRPKRHLCIVGDSETIGNYGYLRSWVEWCQENADVVYADTLSA